MPNEPSARTTSFLANAWYRSDDASPDCASSTPKHLALSLERRTFVTVVPVRIDRFEREKTFLGRYAAEVELLCPVASIVVWKRVIPAILVSTLRSGFSGTPAATYPNECERGAGPQGRAHVGSYTRFNESGSELVRGRVRSLPFATLAALGRIDLVLSVRGVVLGFRKVGLEVLPRPPFRSELLPLVIVGRRAMLVALGVDRRAPTEHLAARLVQDAVVAVFLLGSLKVPFGGSSETAFRQLAKPEGTDGAKGDNEDSARKGIAARLTSKGYPDRSLDNLSISIENGSGPGSKQGGDAHPSSRDTRHDLFLVALSRFDHQNLDIWVFRELSLRRGIRIVSVSGVWRRQRSRVANVFGTHARGEDASSRSSYISTQSSTAVLRSAGSTAGAPSVPPLCRRPEWGRKGRRSRRGALGRETVTRYSPPAIT